ncbi:MAG: hypothetical protein LBL59_08715 [Xanthomonadaceae bacterium]|nr:hypothetical protein [Xanthomonadaceae bacterium]
MIEIRSGAQPASADAAATGVLLARITRDGADWSEGPAVAGLAFVADGRHARKSPAQSWQLRGLASGEAGWFRLISSVADAGTTSTQFARIDGAIGLEGQTGDFQAFLKTLAITPDTTIEIADWWYSPSSF